MSTDPKTIDLAELLDQLDNETRCQAYNGWFRHRDPKEIRAEIDTEIARLTAELADEKAVNEHQRSELQDRLQKQRAAEAELSACQQQLGECSGGYETLEREVASLRAELEEARKDAGPIAKVVDSAHYHDHWHLQIHGITVAGNTGADTRRTFQRLAGQINMAAAITKEKS